MADATLIDPRLGAHRRRAELGLVLLAGAITAAAYVLASLGRNASIPARIGPFLAFVVGLLVIHFLLRYLQRGTLYAFAWYRVALGLVVLAVVGAVHGAAVAVFALTLVPATVGWFAGNHAAGRLRTAHFVRMVDLVLLASGLLAIGRALV